MKPARLGTLVSTFGAALLAMALIAPTAMATTPAKGYEAFAGCPSPAENSTVFACINSVVKSGHFQMGSKDVPITNPITLSGGLDEGEVGKFFANSKGGLAPAKQKVPGGVIGLTGLTWLAEFLGVEALTLYAVTELAGQPTITFDKITLPIKVHLINSVLGNNCYVGSNSGPINLNLTDGTTSPPAPNKPISGKEPTFTFDETLEILHGTGASFVDNSFAAPGANGCVLTLGIIPVNIDGLVNSQSGLPAAAGTNETIQNLDLELVGVHKVYP